MMNEYDRFIHGYFGYPRPTPPSNEAQESLEEMVGILLRVFAPQVEKIRADIYARRYATYEKQFAKYEAYVSEQREEEIQREVKMAEAEDRAAAFGIEFDALDDLGTLGYIDARRLSRMFGSVAEIRAATDEAILRVPGVGHKTLADIRKRTHEHKWDEFKTDGGKTGSYCDGCKARTGFVAC